MKNEHIKVLFKYYSNILEEYVSENMWAITINKEKGIYKLDSIPFYGISIATGDEFFAEFDENENSLVFRKITKYSDNSVVLIILRNKEYYNSEIIRQIFKELNCQSESINGDYISVEILKETNYNKIEKKLMDLENNNIIYYSEPCLSEKHKNDIVK